MSSVGARITREGLAFAAVMTLGATPEQIGILAALTRGPAILVGLTAGGMVDRRPRRPILIGSDLGRALVLASMPIAAWLHVLTLGQVYGVAALVGALSVLFDIADHAYLPTLIDRDQLVDGNSKLATTEGLAEIGGPALYGLLFQILTAPIAIAVNAGTYVFSAVALGLIRAREPAPPPRAAERCARFASGFRAGLASVSADPPVAWLLVIVTAGALFGSFYSALYIIFALKQLSLSAGMLGATVAVGGVAAMFGASLARPVIRRLGIGPAFVVTSLIAGARRPVRRHGHADGGAGRRRFVRHGDRDRRAQPAPEPRAGSSHGPRGRGVRHGAGRYRRGRRDRRRLARRRDRRAPDAVHRQRRPHSLQCSRPGLAAAEGAGR